MGACCTTVLQKRKTFSTNISILINMNFSVEEIFSMYGQYDKFVTIEFRYDSEEYQKFGFRLMGNFIYVLRDRIELHRALCKKEIPRSDGKIKFSPSEVENLTAEQKTDLDKYGILASSIDTIWISDMPRRNRFQEVGKKEIENVRYIKAPKFSGWEELNRVRFGFLNSRYKRGQSLSPNEYIMLWAFRKHFNVEIDKEYYEQNFEKANQEFKDKVRLEELRIKYQELSISEKEIEDFVKLVVKEIEYKNEIINDEINSSTEKINEVAKNYGTEIENLKKICLRFDEDVIAFGEKIIFLGFERFVHIYARHVSETQVGERFANNKTVFQYKFEDIIHIIKLVIESVSDEIQNHFKTTPEKPFRRMGDRSVYYDGHYYRIEIEPNGNLKDFHPYNDDKNIGS